MAAGILIIATTLGVLSLAGAAFWLVVLIEVVWMVRKLPTARDGLVGHEAQLGEASPGVCLIIPAYNEERSIECVARSLLRQDYSKLRVVFALDRCTDDTEGVLRRTLGDDARFSILKIEHCPPDWAGKVNAVWRAVSMAPAAQEADIVAFADADTQFDPGCVRACVAILRREGYGLLSLMSTLTCEHWFEKLVQPVAGYELMRQFPPRRVNREGAAGQRRAVANGQFMMFTRECYWSFGGHENPLVKDELLEDIALAKRARWYGFKAGFIPAAGMLYCRMYESYSAFELGWRRIFAELAHRRPRRLRSYALQLMLTDIVLPLMSVAAAVFGAVVLSVTFAPGAGVGAWTLAVAGVSAGLGVLSIVLMQLVMAIGCWWGRTPQYVGFLHVPGAWFVFLILMQAASDLEAGRPVRWGGRQYIRAARYEGDEGWAKRWLGRKRK